MKQYTGVLELKLIDKIKVLFKKKEKRRIGGLIVKGVEYKGTFVIFSSKKHDGWI